MAPLGACIVTTAVGLYLLFHFLRIKLQHTMCFFKLLKFLRAPSPTPSQGKWASVLFLDSSLVGQQGPKAGAVGGQQRWEGVSKWAARSRKSAGCSTDFAPLF